MGSKSFGAGHSGVAHDVELIQEGWLHLRGGDSAIYKQVTLCAGCRAPPLGWFRLDSVSRPLMGKRFTRWRVEIREREKRAS